MPVEYSPEQQAMLNRILQRVKLKDEEHFKEKGVEVLEDDGYGEKRPAEGYLSTKKSNFAGFAKDCQQARGLLPVQFKTEVTIIGNTSGRKTELEKTLNQLNADDPCTAFFTTVASALVARKMTVLSIVMQQSEYKVTLKPENESFVVACDMCLNWLTKNFGINWESIQTMRIKEAVSKWQGRRQTPDADPAITERVFLGEAFDDTYHAPESANPPRDNPADMPVVKTTDVAEVVAINNELGRGMTGRAMPAGNSIAEARAMLEKAKAEALTATSAAASTATSSSAPPAPALPKQLTAIVNSAGGHIPPPPPLAKTTNKNMDKVKANIAAARAKREATGKKEDEVAEAKSGGDNLAAAASQSKVAQKLAARNSILISKQEAQEAEAKKRQEEAAEAAEKEKYTYKPKEGETKDQIAAGQKALDEQKAKDKEKAAEEKRLQEEKAAEEKRLREEKEAADREKYTYKRQPGDTDEHARAQQEILDRQKAADAKAAAEKARVEKNQPVKSHGDPLAKIKAKNKEKAANPEAATAANAADASIQKLERRLDETIEEFTDRVKKAQQETEKQQQSPFTANLRKSVAAPLAPITPQTPDAQTDFRGALKRRSSIMQPGTSAPPADTSNNFAAASSPVVASAPRKLPSPPVDAKKSSPPPINTPAASTASVIDDNTNKPLPPVPGAKQAPPPPPKPNVATETIAAAINTNGLVSEVTRNNKPLPLVPQKLQRSNTTNPPKP